MLERTVAITKKVLEPITFVLAYLTVFSLYLIGFNSPHLPHISVRAFTIFLLLLTSFHTYS
jgi:hypothetical protein